MKVASWIQGHSRSILFLLALLAVGGIVAALRLPVSMFPTVDFPRVVVSLDAGDRPADQMALQITTPVEEAIRRVPGVVDIRSTSSRGSAEISVNFSWGTDMVAAALQVNAATSRVATSSLPPGTLFDTKRMDPTVFAVLAYSLTSPTLSLTALRDIAQYQMRPLLSGIAGVAQVGVVGGEREEYRVTVAPARLAAHGLTLADVAAALNAANVVQAIGKIEDHYKLYLVVGDTRLKTLDDIRHTVLKSGQDGIVQLDDVARVERSIEPQWLRVTADGRDAVLLNIYQQPGANSVQLTRDVTAALAKYQAALPPDVKVAAWYDQSQLVTDAAASVRDAILIGAVLAAGVLLLFLRNLKITLIAVVVVPVVLAATVVLLWSLNMSFNIMTLGGMAAAVGLVIDDAIVMSEHIVRRMRGAVAGPRDTVMRATIEFFRPLAGSSAATIVIFVPLAFLSGVTGAFFKALSLTMAAALIISFFVTWLAVPLVANRLLDNRDANQKEGGRVTDWMHLRYEWVMRRLLARPIWILLLIAPLCGLGWLAYHKVGSGFMPAMDEGGFIIDYRTQPGTALGETDRMLRQIEDILKHTPEVQTYSRRTGTGLGGGLSEANEGDFFVRLKPPPRRPIDEVMADVQSQIDQNVPGVAAEMAQLMEDMIGDMTAVPQPIEIKLYSDDPRQLSALALKTAEAIRKVPGVTGVRNGIKPAGDALVVQVDRVKAALEGMDPNGVTHMLNNIVAGQVTTQMQEGPKMVGVRVWVSGDLRKTAVDLPRMLLRAPDGHAFPLARIASVSIETGQPQITRENLKRMVAVTARINGRDLGSTVADVQKIVAAPDFLPTGTYFELGGLYQQQQIAFRGLVNVLLAALALVFLLLLFLYEQFRMALSIMVIPLVSMTGVFIGLWATGVELNITSMMGMTMIVGIVTEVAIFYFSEYRDLAGHMPLDEALIQAGKNRMRPILMSVLAAILTLLPLALAIGQGSEMQKPLAIAIISGLIVQLPLVLIAMPVIFKSLKRWRVRHVEPSA
ncbi:efflux RND transporter permease subunit [Ottowia sp.]|uniref:efflux RND transporter permease subunit n=1 Tax=Ottowia sp. TaxID=1898956 RepID=UPI002B93D189|nr:efflux RND transporter permease subunit [Ottowia sp.]